MYSQLAKPLKGLLTAPNPHNENATERNRIQILTSNITSQLSESRAKVERTSLADFMTLVKQPRTEIGGAPSLNRTHRC
eukprot:7787933-Alexandrium_andersonii.AAC.1